MVVGSTVELRLDLRGWLLASMDKDWKKAASLRMDRKEEWLLERRTASFTVEEEGDELTPDVVACVSAHEGFAIGVNVVAPDAGESELLSWAISCMLSPKMGKPRRPCSVTLIGGRLNALKSPLEELGIQVSLRGLPHPATDEVFSALEENVGQPGLPPYTLDTRLKPEAVAEFFQAAVEYYKLEPWKLLECEEPIRVEIEGKKRTVYWGVVMGAQGMERGLSLYRSYEDLEDICEAVDEDDAATIGRATWSMGFSYSHFDDIGPAARNEWLAYQWLLAEPSAYPSALVVDPKGDELIRSPKPRELLDFTAVVRALTAFIRAHEDEISEKDDFEVEGAVEVEVAGKPVRVLIQLPAPEYLADCDLEADPFALTLPFEPEMSPELERAMSIVDRALDEDSKRKRVELAKQAIALCSDCADAYLILAEDAARDAGEERKLLTQAVEAGRRAIGEDRFDGLKGAFWNALVTRPYMRARLRLAEFHLHQGEMDQAVDHYREMLLLNESDNLGVRYPLCGILLRMGRDDEAEKLIAEFEDDCSAFWAYFAALLAFRRNGASAGAGKALKKALAANRHVPDYVLERRPLPEWEPDAYSLGSIEEAILCAESLVPAWQSTEGAVEWLRESESRGQTRRRGV